MRSVKDAGPEEVNRIRRRVGRARLWERISQEDHDFIQTRLDEVEERMRSMEEEDDGTA
jgi:hypothetical protein